MISMKLGGHYQHMSYKCISQYGHVCPSFVCKSRIAILTFSTQEYFIKHEDLYKPLPLSCLSHCKLYEIAVSLSLSLSMQGVYRKNIFYIYWSLCILSSEMCVIMWLWLLKYIISVTFPPFFVLL